MEKVLSGGKVRSKGRHGSEEKGDFSLFPTFLVRKKESWVRWVDSGVGFQLFTEFTFSEKGEWTILGKEWAWIERMIKD